MINEFIITPFQIFKFISSSHFVKNSLKKAISDNCANSEKAWNITQEHLNENCDWNESYNRADNGKKYRNSKLTLKFFLRNITLFRFRLKHLLSLHNRPSLCRLYEDKYKLILNKIIAQANGYTNKFMLKRSISDLIFAVTINGYALKLKFFNQLRSELWH